MKLLDCIKLLSPLDVVVLEIEEQKIVKSNELDDILPASFLVEATEQLIELGDTPTRNVTYWLATEGEEKSQCKDWQEKLIKTLSVSNMNWSLSDLDNTKKVLSVSCEVYMIAHNCNALTKEHLKRVKCARIHTAFGQIEADI